MSTRIYLRALELDDYKISIAWRKNTEIWSKLAGTHYFVSEAYEKVWVEQKVLTPKSDEIVLAVCSQENDQYIGNVYLTNIDWINKSAHIHIIIGDNLSRGKGIGVESIMLMVKYAFEEKNLHRIYGRILSDNIASIKMFKKCKFTQEGILRQNIYKDGAYKDMVIVSILKEEFISNSC